MWIKIPKELIIDDKSLLVNVRDCRYIYYEYNSSFKKHRLVIEDYWNINVDSLEAYEKLLDYIFEQCNNNHNEIK